MKVWRGRTLALAIVVASAAPGAFTGGLLGTTPASARATPVVEITVVADETCAPGLRDIVSEHLADLARNVTWTCAHRIDEDALFRSGARTPDAVQIWIDVSLATEMRLLLRDQLAGRFVVRRLELGHGVDPVAREEIAQIVRAAAFALASGPDETLTRDQARAAVLAWPARPASPPRETEQPLSRAPAPRGELSASQSRVGAADHTKAAVDVGISIAGRAFSRPIPVLGELGAFAQVSRGGWSGWAEGAYQLPARHRADPVGVDLSSSVARVGLTLSARAGRRLTVGGGAGVGAARTSFRPVEGMGEVNLAAPSSFVAFSGRLLVRAELGLSARLTLGLGLFGDMTTAHIHYDVLEPAGARRVVSAFRVQPGLELRIGWRL